jgi:hypothetical protein
MPWIHDGEAEINLEDILTGWWLQTHYSDPGSKLSHRIYSAQLLECDPRLHTLRFWPQGQQAA